jgi:predicted nuclease with TOPRIM domain
MTIKTWQERMVDAGHAASTDGMRINMHAQAEINELREALEAALQDRAAMATELTRVRAKWTEESLIMEEVCRANTLLEKRLAAWDKNSHESVRSNPLMSNHNSCA